MQSALREFKANVFAALAHPTRIAVVDELREGEVSAGELADRLEAEPSNLSQHLAVLRDRDIVVRRKDGTQVYYALRDPVLLKVLDVLKRYFNAHLRHSATKLDELRPRRPRNG
jgi:DNA-binding transcriptional ArsR family regulator